MIKVRVEVEKIYCKVYVIQTLVVASLEELDDYLTYVEKAVSYEILESEELE